MMMAPKIFRELPDLPNVIRGERVDLFTTSGLAWPKIRNIPDYDLVHVLSNFGWDRDDLPAFKDRAHFGNFILKTQQRELNWDDLSYGLRRYWMIDKAQDHIVGMGDAVLHNIGLI